MRKLIYLASPYTCNSVFGEQARFKRVCKVAGRLMKEGHFVFSPIAHTHPIAELSSLPVGFEYWREYDELMLSKCDELWILTIEGWEESKGVAAERDIAERLNIPIKFIDE